MKKKILSFLIAVITLFGQGLSACCIAAPKNHHKDRPAHHKVFKFWHRDKDKPSVKKKKHHAPKHKIKKDKPKHKWFRWKKDEHKVHNKHKKFEKKKKFKIKKHHKKQKKIHKNKQKRFKFRNIFRRHRSDKRR